MHLGHLDPEVGDAGLGLGGAAEPEPNERNVIRSPSWTLLTESEATEAYRQFKSRFQFVNAGGKDAPAIRAPNPYIVLKAPVMPPDLDDNKTRRLR
jgi:hypothetical protein